MVYLTPDQERSARLCLHDPLHWGRCIGYDGDGAGRLEFGWVHKELVDHWLDGYRQSGCIPRGHGKSTLGAVILPSWKMLRDPAERAMIASVTKELSEEFVGEIRERLRGHVNLCGQKFWLADVFEWMEPVGRSEKQRCSALNIVGREGTGREPNFFATSPTSSNAGKHPTYAHLDDLTTEKNCDNFKLRQKGISFIKQLTPIMKYRLQSPVTHAGTPWAFNDTTEWISRSPEWSQLRYSVLDGRDGDRTLCPSYMTYEEYLEISNNDDYEEEFVSAQFLCKMVGGSKQVFKEELIEDATKSAMPLHMLKDSRYDNYGTVAIWDPTHRIDGSNTDGDANGIVIVKPIPAGKCESTKLVNPKQNVWNVIRARQDLGGADATMEWLEKRAKELHPDLSEIWIEDNAAQIFAKPWLERGGDVNGIRIRGIKVNQQSLQFRLQAIATAMRKGAIKLPAKFPGRDLLVRQLTEYPKSDYKDVPAALALLCTKYEREGTIYNPEAGQRPPWQLMTKMA